MLRTRGLHNARYYNCAFGICICVQRFYASVYIMDGTLAALKYSNPRYLQTGLTKRLGAGDEEQRAPSAQTILSNVRTYFDWIETTWQRRFHKTLELPVSVFPSWRSRLSNSESIQTVLFDFYGKIDISQEVRVHFPRNQFVHFVTK